MIPLKKKHNFQCFYFLFLKYKLLCRFYALCYKCKTNYLSKNKSENDLASLCPDIILDKDDTEAGMQNYLFAFPECDDMEQMKRSVFFSR